MLLAGLALPPALLQGCGPTGSPLGPRSCGIRPQAEIPLRVVDNIPLVDVRLNGAPATMVLDTGAERTVLTSLNHICAAPENSLRESLVT